MSDRDLIDGFLKGDRQSHQTIQEWILVVIRSRAHGREISGEDIASDTTTKLLNNLRDGQFRSESSLKTYVQRITKYTLIDALRRTRQTLGDYEDLPDGEDIIQGLIDKENLALFQRILSLIGPECRNLWKMIFYEELPYAEIASKLGISEGAVKTRVLRCKQKAIEIRKKLT